MTLSDEQFENEFDIKNDNLPDTIIKIINEKDITNINELLTAGKVAKHVK